MHKKDTYKLVNELFQTDRSLSFPSFHFCPWARVSSPEGDAAAAAVDAGEHGDVEQRDDGQEESLTQEAVGAQHHQRKSLHPMKKLYRATEQLLLLAKYALS